MLIRLKSLHAYVLLYLLSGLLFHFDLSGRNFGEVPGWLDYSLITLLIGVSVFVVSVYKVVRSPLDPHIVFFLLFFAPSIYLWRLPILDKLIGIFFLIYILRARYKFELSFYTYFVIGFLLFSALLGLFYSFKSVRYFGSAMYLLGIVAYFKRYEFVNKLSIATIVWITISYNLSVIVAYLIMIGEASFSTIFAYGLGYSPTTFVNVPNILVLSLFSRRLSFRQFNVVFLFSIIIAIMSDSRVGLYGTLIVLLWRVLIERDLKVLMGALGAVPLISLLGLLLFENTNYLQDAFLGIFRIFEIGGTKTVNYYGQIYESSSGDTGRWLMLASSFVQSLKQIIYLFGTGTYGYYFVIFDEFQYFESIFNTNLVDTLNGTIGIGLSSIPRPPMMNVFLVEYGFFFTLAFIAGYAVTFFKVKSLRLFIINVLLLSLFIELDNFILVFLLLTNCAAIVYSDFNLSENSVYLDKKKGL